MRRPRATPNARRDTGRPASLGWALARWYVARALGQSGTSALESRLTRRASVRTFALVALVAASLPLGACGGAESQDESEPTGEYQVDVTRATFPNRQRLAETSDLIIGVTNTGEETIPEVAVTMFIADEEGEPAGSGQPFATRIDTPGVADPNRPVWIVENKYPILKGPNVPTGESKPKGSSPGTVAQTNTFGFGELPAGERVEMVWRLTAVRAGTYTIDYEVSAGLYGNAQAVGADGSMPEGKFVVTITDQPPKARVNAQGEVVISPNSREGNPDTSDEPVAPGVQNNG